MCTCHCRYFPDNGTDWDSNLDKVLEATLFPTLNYSDNILVFFLCSKCVVCCNCAARVRSEGGKTVNKIHAMAKGTCSTVGRTRCFYHGWMSQVTTTRNGCISSHRLQDHSLLVLNSHIGINVRHSLLLGLCSTLQGQGWHFIVHMHLVSSLVGCRSVTQSSKISHNAKNSD